VENDKIILTGSSGFIGSHVAEYFCGKGVNPVCLVRRDSNTDFLHTLPVDIVYGDITNPSDVFHACGGCGCVIHTAGKVNDWGAYEDFYRVNVEGTLNVMDAAIKSGIRDVIITGSNSCYGEESSQEIKTEASPYRSHYNYFLDRYFPSALNFYRDTKTLANEAARARAVRHNVNLTIIEPVWVYGEREYHTGFYEYLKTVRSGIPVFPGSRKNKFHTIYCRNLAKLYYLAYEARLTGVNTFIAGDNTAEYQWVFFAMLCREAGLTMPFMIPKQLVYPLAFTMELAATLFGVRHSPMLTRAKVNIFYDNIEYSAEKACTVLKYQPDYTFEESIKKTVAWYFDNHLL
jgi:nucleoside-diphosphate-sugar epimerase